MSEEKVYCRANICLDCYNGIPMFRIYPEGPKNDRTYDLRTDSVVCDACYIAMGQPSFNDLDELNSEILLAQIGKVSR